MRLAQVILFVKDVDRMSRFYRDVLGLVPVDEPGDAGFVRLEAGGARLALHRVPDAVAAQLVVGDPPRARADVAVKVCFHADDVDAERARLAAAGVRVGDVHRYGAVAFVDVVDPEGNVIQLTTR